MYPISQLYLDALRRPDREFIVMATVDGVQYNDNEIVDFTIENSLVSSDGFEVGTAIPSKLVVTIRTNQTIPDNARIVPFLSLSLSGMTWEEATYPWKDMRVTWEGALSDWMPLGEFFIDSREKINGVWTFTCYDRLVFADVAYVSSLAYPASMKAVWDEICGRLDYVYDSSVVINPSYQIQAGPAGFTMRQVMGYIAGANSANVIVGKDGTIRFKRFAATDPPAFEMTTSDYIRVKQVNPIKNYSRVVVTYDTEDSLTFEAGVGGENLTLNLENPFMTQTMVNNLRSTLNGFNYIPISMDARGFPQLEHGDIIGFEQNESLSWLDTATAWQDMHIPWNGMVKYKSVILKQTYSFKGGLKMAIEAPSVSEQQSEFKVDGSLTTAVNKLNKTAVKEGKAYYGATITRTAGLTIEREDHASKAVFNSDELSFYANGDRALWFDLPSRKFKFGGDLEAAGGTFSGTLQGVDGVFSGTLEAANGTFTGTLQAANGTFTGTLQGANGTFSGTVSAGRVEGGEIVGATIEGGIITGATIRTSSTGSRGVELRSGYADINIYSGVSGNDLVFAIQDMLNDMRLWFSRTGYIEANNEIRINAPNGVYVNNVQIG
ncbi:hypothetical protein [Paenibacillus puldeungensis]